MSAPPLESKHNKVTEVEDEIESRDIQILTNTVEIRQQYIHLINSAKSEISLMIGTPNALRRNLNGGIINMLRDAAEKKNVKINLIIPAYEDQIHKVCRYFSKYWAYAHDSEFSNQNNSANDSANTHDKIYFPNSGQTILIHNRHKG